MASQESLELRSNASTESRRKRNGGLKWIANLLSNPRGRATVAPEPEQATWEAKAETSEAWEANGPLLEEPPSEDLRNAATDELQPPESPKQVQSSAALAQSNAVSAALASEDKPKEIGSYIEVCSRQGKEPLPMELLDEPGEVSDQPDVNLLPPLPAVDTQRLQVGNVPGSANSAGMESAEPSSRKTFANSDQSAPPQPRPTSFRRQPGLKNETALSPKKGVFSLSSRPTTAGGETSLTCPTSRQSSRSISWHDQWTPGGQELSTKQAAKNIRQPLPPPLPASTTPASQEDEKQMERGKPLSPLHENSSANSPARQDPSAMAAKRASQRTTMQWATAPTNNRSRWKSKKDAEHVDDLNSKGVATPLARFAPPSRPSSSASSRAEAGGPASAEFAVGASRPASRELALGSSRPASRELAVGFSDLAVSFASLDDDM